MGAHILEIIVMLLIAAILGFLIAWFWKKNKQDSENGDTEKEIRTLKNKLAEKDKHLGECQEKMKLLETEIKEVETEEEIALKRIKEKAKNINFERIGIASEDEKDDLKIIKGIGPFIEKKLNVLGIYTFRQIANFTEEDRKK